MVFVIQCYGILGHNKTAEEDIANRQRELSIMQDAPEKTSDVEVPNDIEGELCIGSQKDAVTNCCIKILFGQGDYIYINASLGPKDTYKWMKGSYIHNNYTETWECNIEEKAFWTLFIVGEKPIKMISNPDLGKTFLTKQGTLVPLKLHYVRSWMKYIEPDMMIEDQSMHIVKDHKVSQEWQIQVSRESLPVNIEMIFVDVDKVIPEITVWPKSLNVQEGQTICLTCGTRIKLPLNSTISWFKGKDSRGSITYGSEIIIHKSMIGNLDWFKQNISYRLDNVTLKDQGIYQCCIFTTNKNLCEQVNVVINPHPINVSCVGNAFIPSSPFQINHFQSKPLLKDGKFVKILWHFNISHWKISTRFPQCKKYLLNMEQGMEHWFRNLDLKRSKRDILGNILGGVGTIGTITNSMGLSSLQKDLESAGLLNSKTMHVQRGLNQII
ncbi:hypothetical protein XENTR_v10000032 [Xenopus tropicalis]|nr:hypothetical protein XENTR_v10000032 [Xenopus tropicalis]